MTDEQWREFKSNMLHAVRKGLEGDPTADEMKDAAKTLANLAESQRIQENIRTQPTNRPPGTPDGKP